MTRGWLVVLMVCGCSSESGLSGATLIELTAGDGAGREIVVSASGEAFGATPQRIDRLVDRAWVPVPFDNSLGLITGLGYDRQGLPLVTTVFYTTPPSSALLRLVGGSVETLMPLTAPGPVLGPAGLPSGHVYVQRSSAMTLLWSDPALGWQPAAHHRSLRHTVDGVLAVTDDAIVSIAGDADADTVIAPCSAFEEPCERLRVAGQDRDGRIYINGFEPVLYVLEPGATSPIRIPLPDGGTALTGIAGPDGFIGELGTPGGEYALYSLEPDQTALSPVGRTFTSIPRFTVTPAGRVYVYSEGWLAEVAF